MRNVSLRAALAAAALSAAMPAAATNGMRLIGFGPVQNSMGGASAATALDGATVVTNPAGMSALGRRVDLAGMTFAPFVEYHATGAASGATLTSDRPVDFIPTLTAVYPINDQLTAGVAVVGMGGMGVDYKADLFGSPTYTSYLTGRLAPAIAYELTDRLSFGAALNLDYAQMAYDVATSDQSLNLAFRPATGAFGVGATFGLTWKTPEDVTIGLAYETKTNFQDFEFDIPAHTINTPQGPAQVPGGVEKLAFDQPDVLTLGAAFNPTKLLLVAVDVQWIRWTTVMGQDLPKVVSDPNLTGALAWNMDWADQFVFKIGGQYDLTKEIKLRAGYNWGDSPLNPSRAMENIAFPAVAKHHFTVGGGYDLGGRLALNASILYSPQATVSGSNDAQGIAFYESKMSQFAFDVGAAWKF